MFAAIDQRRPGLDQRGTQSIGAARRFAPTGAKGDVLQAAALESVGTSFDRKNGRIGVGEDDQTFLALTLGEVIDGRYRCVDQQSIARQQHIEAGARFEAQFVFAVEMHTVAQAATPRSIDLRTQHTSGHLTLQMQLLPGEPGLGLRLGIGGFY